MIMSHYGSLPLPQRGVQQSLFLEKQTLGGGLRARNHITGLSYLGGGK